MKILLTKKSDPKADTTTLEKEIKIIDPEFELTEQEDEAITIK
jgi:hypothetical protein